MAKHTAMVRPVLHFELESFGFLRIEYTGILYSMFLCMCKHKISQLQKIKPLKKNMVCKYKFVLMNNEYNLYLNFFTKEYPLILSSLNLTQTKDLDFGWKMD